MPIVVNGQTYYRTAEVCQMVGISRSTLFRSLRQGIFSEARHRDWRGWRLFTEEEVTGLNAKVNRIIEADHLRSGVRGARKVPSYREEVPSGSTKTQDSLAENRHSR
jgi:hypothetical protein